MFSSFTIRSCLPRSEPRGCSIIQLVSRPRPTGINNIVRVTIVFATTTEGRVVLPIGHSAGRP
eukprot:466789-Lingulodinium_polyedra.AAC.1